MSSQPRYDGRSFFSTRSRISTTIRIHTRPPPSVENTLLSGRERWTLALRRRVYRRFRLTLGKRIFYTNAEKAVWRVFMADLGVCGGLGGFWPVFSDTGVLPRIKAKTVEKRSWTTPQTPPSATPADPRFSNNLYRIIHILEARYRR